MMATGKGDSTRPATLNQRIRLAERQLAERQRSIGICIGALGRNLREILRSPLTVLVAAGAGFGLGQFSKRQRQEPAPESEPVSARPSLFATLLDAFTLASSVMAMLPPLRRRFASDDDATG